MRLPPPDRGRIVFAAARALLQSGLARHGYQEFANRGNAFPGFLIKPIVLNGGIPMRDSISETGHRAQPIGKRLGDRASETEDIERATRVVGRIPPRIGHLVCSEVDSLLHREKQVEGCEVARFRQPRLGVAQPVLGSRELARYNVCVHHARPRSRNRVTAAA